MASGRKGLSKEAVELAQVNEGLAKLVAKAIEKGHEEAFENINKIQEILKNVNYLDAKSVAEARAKILDITKAKTIKEVIRCTV